MSQSQIQQEQHQAREVVARTVMCTPTGRHCPGQPSPMAIKIARKNALGLEFAAHYPDAAAQLEQEQQRQDAFHRVMHETSRLLLDHGIEHICIKFRKLYRYYDSNVDVVVDPRQWAQSVELIQGQGYTPHVMFKEPDKIMFDKPASVSVHLHPGVTWNGVPYFDQQSLWRRSTRSADRPWLELAPEDDFLVNLAHNLFENYEVSLGDVLYFKRFIEAHTFDLGALEQIAAANGWRYGFRQAYRQIHTLVRAWTHAQHTGTISAELLRYPYQIQMPVLARTFGQRIASNLGGLRLRTALREVYAYPAFYALKRRHDLPWLAQLEARLRS